MTAAELIAVLQRLPGHLPVMVGTEGGVDCALHVRVITAVRDRHDWANTPVGQYREIGDQGDLADAIGEPFLAVFIGLEGP